MSKEKNELITDISHIVDEAYDRGYEDGKASVIGRKQGHWIVIDEDILSVVFKCSECSRIIYVPKGEALIELNKYFPYCHCGARMTTEINVTSKINENRF